MYLNRKNRQAGNSVMGASKCVSNAGAAADIVLY